MATDLNIVKLGCVTAHPSARTQAADLRLSTVLTPVPSAYARNDLIPLVEGENDKYGDCHL
jgi:hypothetical protein